MTDENETITIESLNSVFKDEAPEAEKETQVTEKEESVPEPAKEAKSKGVKEEAATPAEEEKSVPFKALKDERQKRQKLEEEVARLSKHLAPPVEAPDPVEDPEGYKQHVRSTIEKEALTERINSSRSRMLEKHDDYEDMEKTFTFLAMRDPSLIQQMNADYDPANFAYQKGKEYHEEIETKLREKILADIQPKSVSKEEERKRSAVNMPDLTKAAAKGSNSEAPAKLSDLKDMFADSPI